MLRALGSGALAFDLAQFADVVEGLADRDLEIVEIDRLGDEIEGAAVHCGAQICHVAIGRDDDRADRRLLLAQPREQRQPVHDRHVDVKQQKIDVGLGRQHSQRLLAVTGKAEDEFALADLAPETLRQQQLEIGLVIDGEYLAAHTRVAAVAACRERGRRIVNSVNSPSRLSTVIVPPCCWVTIS